MPRKLRVDYLGAIKHVKNDPGKLAIAARLRRETTLTRPWIAARRQAGTWKSLNAKLHRWKKSKEAIDT